MNASKNHVNSRLTLHELFIEQKKLLSKNQEVNFDIFLDQDTINGNFWKKLLLAERDLIQQRYSSAKTFGLELTNSNQIPPLIKAEAYNLLGRIARLHRLFPEAQKFYEQAENVFSSVEGHLIDQMRIKFNLTNLLLFKAELGKAIKEYKKILNLIGEKNHEFTDKLIIPLKIKILQNLALSFMYQGEFDFSTIHFEEGLILANNYLGEPQIKADLCLNYATLTRAIDDVEKTKNLLSQALQIYKSLKVKNLYAKSYIELIREEVVNNQNIQFQTDIIHNLIKSWKNATGQDVIIRLIEIAERLLMREKLDETEKLIQELLKEDHPPEIEGRIRYIVVQVAFSRSEYEAVLNEGKQVLKLCNMINDDTSALAVQGTLLIAELALNPNNSDIETKVINLLEKYNTNYQGILEFCEAIYPLLWQIKNFKLITLLLENYEIRVVKKSRNNEALKHIYSDLIVIHFFQNKRKNIKKHLKQFNLSPDEVFKNTRWRDEIKTIDSQKFMDFLKNA
ncbi:MAG: tetratricopeptide repeat protein [Candidatus Hodarchaeales archaeon]|jgi:tetratricopeptide (TPR) repeat protein